LVIIKGPDSVRNVSAGYKVNAQGSVKTLQRKERSNPGEEKKLPDNHTEQKGRL